MQAKLRRYETTLTTLGIAVIAYGVWNIIKAVIYFITTEKDIIGSDDLSESSRFMYFLVIGVVFFILIVDLILRVLIGVGARNEGLGKKSGGPYLVIAFIMIVFGVAALIIDVVQMPFTASAIFDDLATVMLDVTSVITLVWLAATSIGIKKIRAALREEGGD